MGTWPLWRELPPPVRALGRWLTLVQLAGYTTSLVFIWHTTRLTPAGISDHYRGADPAGAEGAMQFPKSFSEMLTLTHTHLLAMAVIFAFSGLGLTFCSRPTYRVQRWLVVEPFVALLISFAALWLVRYVDARFSLLLELSSFVMACTFYLQCGLILLDLHRADRGE